MLVCLSNSPLILLLYCSTAVLTPLIFLLYCSTPVLTPLILLLYCSTAVLTPLILLLYCSTAVLTHLILLCTAVHLWLEDEQELNLLHQRQLSLGVQQDRAVLYHGGEGRH